MGLTCIEEEQQLNLDQCPTVSNKSPGRISGGGRSKFGKSDVPVFLKMSSFMKMLFPFHRHNKSNDIASPILDEIKLCSSLLDQLNDSCIEALDEEENRSTIDLDRGVSSFDVSIADGGTVENRIDATGKEFACTTDSFIRASSSSSSNAVGIDRREFDSGSVILSSRNHVLLHPVLGVNSLKRLQQKKACSSVSLQYGKLLYAIQPPENELQKVGGVDRVMSEHELRVQRSLQRLNLPDWYKNCPSLPAQGFLLGKRNSDAAAHWPGLGSKTTSLSSLGSTQSAAAATTPRSPTTGHLLSPSPTPSAGGGFTRWSTSRLNSSPNSASTSPSGSARSSFNYRQPYLGWRSQERIARPRTPAERLAAGLLPLKQQHQNVPNLSEVHTSIKEVTSAIANYVSKGDDRLSPAPHRHDHTSSRSASPRGSKNQLCWLESSFVGCKPLEVPETPLTATPPRAVDLRLDLTPATATGTNMKTVNNDAFQ